MPVQPFTMSDVLERGWSFLLLRGVAAIALGLCLLVFPQASAQALVMLFGAYVLVDGALGTYSAFKNRSTSPNWWWMLIWSLFGLLIGAAVLVNPAFGALMLVILIASWTVVSGVMQFFVGVGLRKEVPGAWLLMVGGAIFVLLGLMLVAKPDTALLDIVWMLALCTILTGALLVFFAFKVRTYRKQLPAESAG